MREQIRDKGRLEHILQAIGRVFEFSNGVKREDFQKDSILYFAIVKMSLLRPCLPGPGYRGQCHSIVNAGQVPELRQLFQAK